MLSLEINFVSQFQQRPLLLWNCRAFTRAASFESRALVYPETFYSLVILDLQIRSFLSECDEYVSKEVVCR